MRQNSFAAGAPRWTSLGSLQRSPRPLAGFGKKEWGREVEGKEGEGGEGNGRGGVGTN